MKQISLFILQCTISILKILNVIGTDITILADWDVQERERESYLLNVIKSTPSRERERERERERQTDRQTDRQTETER